MPFHYLLSIHYVIINEICTNKPHRMRRPEAIGGIGGQTNYFKYPVLNSATIEMYRIKIN